MGSNGEYLTIGTETFNSNMRGVEVRTNYQAGLKKIYELAENKYSDFDRKEQNKKIFKNDLERLLQNY